MQLLDSHYFYLVGIKGVAMTSIAQCLLDAGKQVRGSDVSKDFVTAHILQGLALPIEDIAVIPDFRALQTQAVIYTAAHQGIDNPQVQAAQALGIPVYSQAEALATFFNAKQGIAVCGVGGKSTVSAMITFALEHIEPKTHSFSVGVGEIIGLQQTGAWREQGTYFVAEADEYVIDPHAVSKGQTPTPRFAFLNPSITICTNLRYDHPDVYKDFEATKETFLRFFRQIKPNGILIINGDNEDLVALTKQLQRDDLHILSFGKQAGVNYQLSSYDWSQLQVPGEFNQLNALAALACLSELGFEQETIHDCLQKFRSTKRRFELVAQNNQTIFYDDYAHHPAEILAVIDTLNQKFPEYKKIIAFQPHTFSRTRQLFDAFVDALASHTQATDEIALIDIFPSAREAHDSTMNSDLLVTAIQQKYPHCRIQNLHSMEALAAHIKQTAPQLCITLGAGDIYLVHDLLQKQ